MKVEQGKPEFTPITITLETQDEVDWLAHCANYSSEKDFPFTYVLWNSLKYLRKEQYDSPTTSITKN